MTKELKPPRLHPPDRWSEFDTSFGEENHIDTIIREILTPWPSESRIAGLQAILAEEVTDEGRRVLRELDGISGDINREIKELAYNLGHAHALEGMEPPTKTPEEDQMTIRDESISVRLHPYPRWEELDDGEAEHPVDIIIRETLGSWLDLQRIAQLHALLLDLLARDGRTALLELEQLRTGLAQEQKQLAYDLGHISGTIAGKRLHLAASDDPWLTALVERLHRVIIEDPCPTSTQMLALVQVLWSLMEPGRPPSLDPAQVDDTDKP